MSIRTCSCIGSGSNVVFRLFMSMDTRYQEFMRFCIVGAVCTALDMAIFYLFRVVVPYQIALVGGYVTVLLSTIFLPYVGLSAQVLRSEMPLALFWHICSICLLSAWD